MALNKRTYVDQETVITAQNLNDIQDAIIENEEAIEDQGEVIEGKYAKPSGGIPASDMASAVQTSLGKADTAYQKPSGGIPSTDLASGVQTSLGKADTAYQKPSGGIPSTDMASAVQTSLDKADSAYQKPQSGIPSTDLASGVQTSLGKADTALQSSDIDNTLTVAGKAADAKKTGDEISGLKNTLNRKADVIYDTASGDIASFPDGADGLPVKDLTVAIEPVQSGTGDPSPTNVRPISGWTGCNISHSGADTSDPTVIPISWQSEAGTVYGGTLNVTSGLLTVDRAMVDLGTINWYAHHSLSNVYTGDGGSLSRWLIVPGVGIASAICSSYVLTTSAAGGVDVIDCSIALGTGGSTSIYVHDSTASDLTEFRNSISGVQLCYELTTPKTYQLDPVTVTTLLGQNNIWADCGPVSVEYPADTKAYVDNEIGEVENTLTQLGNDLDALETVVTKNYNCGSPVNITNYSSASNPFIAPSDGYIALFTDNDSSTASFSLVDENATTLAVQLLTNRAGANFVFIKKGSKGFATTIASGAVRFIPLS